MSGQVDGQVFEFVPAKLNVEIARRALTDEDAARLVGVTTKTMWRWRHAKAKPQARHVRAMADAFDRDPVWFLTNREPEDVAA